MAAVSEKLPREVVERLLWRPEDTPAKLEKSIELYNSKALPLVEVRYCNHSDYSSFDGT